MSAGSFPSEYIQDTSQYYAVVLAIDSYNNASSPTLAGPTMSYNNTYINSQLELTVSSGPDAVSENVLESNSGLLLSVYAYHFDNAQQQVAIEDAQLEMTLTYGTDTLVLNGQTDSNGQWVAVDVDDLHDPAIPQNLLDFSADPDGELDIDVSMQSIEIVDTQPYTSASASSSIGTAMMAELAGPASSIDMDANHAVDLNITLTAVDSINPAPVSYTHLRAHET